MCDLAITIKSKFTRIWQVQVENEHISVYNIGLI